MSGIPLWCTAKCSPLGVMMPLWCCNGARHPAKPDTWDTVRRMDLSLTVTGTDGFTLTGRSSMAEISRDPADLVAQTRGRHHQYPDGFLLYCGTMFAPVQDRDGPGQGFTHHLGDVVTIAAPELGALTNTVRLSTEAPEWTFGTGALMRNLAARQLL